MSYSEILSKYEGVVKNLPLSDKLLLLRELFAELSNNKISYNKGDILKIMGEHNEHVTHHIDWCADFFRAEEVSSPPVDKITIERAEEELENVLGIPNIVDDVEYEARLGIVNPDRPWENNEH